MMDANQVQIVLRCAGWAAIRLRNSGPTTEMRVQQIDTVGDPNTEYGYTPEQTRRSPPTSMELGLMDEVHGLLPLIDDRRVRRVVALRMLWNEDRGRHVYSYRRIGNMIRSSHGHVRDLYERGVDRLVSALNKDAARLRKIEVYRSVYTSAD